MGLFHYKDAVLPSCLYNGNPYIWKDSLNVEKVLWCHQLTYFIYWTALNLYDDKLYCHKPFLVITSALFSGITLHLFQLWSLIIHRDHSGYGLSQWEEALLCNASSHWPSPYSEWPLIQYTTVIINREMLVHCWIWIYIGGNMWYWGIVLKIGNLWPVLLKFMKIDNLWPVLLKCRILANGCTAFKLNDQCCQ